MYTYKYMQMLNEDADGKSGYKNVSEEKKNLKRLPGFPILILFSIPFSILRLQARHTGAS